MSSASSVSIVEHFELLEDPRIERNKEHKLIDIIVIAICGMVCGCECITQIERYGEKKRDWLSKFLELPNGIPSHDTISRVLNLLDPEKFVACFSQWAGSLAAATGQVIAIDGKTLRRSFDCEKNPLHVVSAWARANHVSLGQVAVDEKSNEITAIPKLLELIDVSGALVTIDAMGCQKEIAAKIREQGGDYVLAVKENQPHLHEDVFNRFEELAGDDYVDVSCSQYQTHERGHGRQESRYYYQADVPEQFRNKEAWRDIRTIGMAVCFRGDGQGGDEQREFRYYITSMERDVERFAAAVRGHWAIENSLHWVLDVTFDEDQSRIRKGNGPENVALMRRLAVTLLKRETSSKDSTRTKRLVAGWDDDYLMKVLTGN